MLGVDEHELGPLPDVGRPGLDLEEPVGIDRGQELECVLAQLGADESKLGRNSVGDREAHAPDFGIRAARP